MPARVLPTARQAFPERSDHRTAHNVRVNPASVEARHWSYRFLRLAHGSHEILHKHRVFLARFRFHAATNIHRVWFGRANRCSNITRREAAGWKYAAAKFGATRDVPSKSLAASTMAAAIESIEQKCSCVFVGNELTRGKRIAYANSLNDRQRSLQARDSGGRFLAV